MPSDESSYILFALFSIVSVFSASYSMSSVDISKYQTLIHFLYASTLLIASYFLMLPIWYNNSRLSNTVSVIWVFSLFYVLVFVSGVLAITSHFGQFQLMMFLLSMVVLSMLVRWQTALAFIATGIFVSIQFFKWYAGVEEFSGNFGSLQFKVIYALVLVSSILIAFFKPQQDHLQATESENTHLSEQNTSLAEENKQLAEEKEILDFQVDDFQNKVAIQEKEIKRLSETAQRILNNVNHELRLPVGNVMNFADMLGDGIDKFNEDQLKTISEEVVKNSNRLSTMILNMLDLAMLEAKKIELAKTTLNISEMVAERSKRCFKNYAKDKKLKLSINIEPEILAKVDANYMRQVVDNIVINAINYTPSGGEVKIMLTADSKGLLLEVKDTGLGIPETEKYTIFEAFAVSSKTLSKAEGRGLGLALCKRAVEAHGGKITVDSDGEQGAHFKVWLGGVMRAAV